MTEHDWMTPGAAVCIITESRSGGGSITTTTVDRVLKRDVVLANGERFNRERPIRRAGTWDPPTRLVAADDPVVAKMRRVNKRTRLRNTVDDCYSKWRAVTGAARLDAAELVTASESLSAAIADFIEFETSDS